MLWFLIGFTVIGTAGIGGGWLSFAAGVGIMTYSGVLFRAARAKEE